jgi:hypothetical protein
MSCPICGIKIQTRKFGMLFMLMALIIISFGLSIYFMPFGIFVLSSILLLVALHYLEKQYDLIFTKEIRCPACGHKINSKHMH